MGIVVCLAMLVALILMLPQPLAVNHALASRNTWQHKLAKLALPFIFILGLWNFAWYGLQHLSAFWGQAALISGLVMMMAAMLLTVEAELFKLGLLQTVYQLLKRLRATIFLGLLASFALYAVTLVQLNMGLPIVS